VSVIGIVALSLLVGMFILAMLALSGWLVYLLIVFRRELSALRLSFKSFIDDTGNLLTLHRTEIRSAFETQSKSLTATLDSLDNSIANRLSELDEIVTRFGVILAEHRTRTDAQIQTINGQELSAAVNRFDNFTKTAISAATRIERAASAIGTFTKEWLSDRAIDESIQPLTEGIDLSTGYAATAPGEPPFVTRSRVALNDARALEEESLSVTEGHQPPTDE